MRDRHRSVGSDDDSGVAGVQTPAFVERIRAGRRPVIDRSGTSVAGVQTPAFVERGRPAVMHGRAEEHVSPEFRLRPSLSVLAGRRGGAHGLAIEGVAGVQTPAFVERRLDLLGARERTCVRRVAGVQTPAFVERCLIESQALMPSIDGVSPEFRLRPSLSGLRKPRKTLTCPSACRVAGVQTPAFVERFQSGNFDDVSLPRCRRSSDSGLR